MFESEINKYAETVAEDQRLIVGPMGDEQYRERNEVLFSCHSCGIEGNSFSVDDTRDLFEQGLGYYPSGKIHIQELNSDQMDVLNSIIDYVCQEGDITPETMMQPPYNQIRWSYIFGERTSFLYNYLTLLHNVIA